MEALKLLNSLDSIQALKDIGAEIFLVGGIVRDYFLEKKSKDIDIIVRLIDEKQLMSVLEKFGKVDKVGESFGVVKFLPNQVKLDEPIDIAFPRFDRKATEEEKQAQIKEFGKVTGRGIVTDSDPMLSIEDDLERRDFTINSVAMALNGTIVDPFNGMQDLKDGIIRATSPLAFSEDPLRMMRAVQFASRFDFIIEEGTWKMILDNKEQIKDISGERTHDELVKIFEKGDIQLGLELFEKSGLRSEIFPGVLNNILVKINRTDIKTIEDFFFIICPSSEDFMKKFKGEKNIGKGIKALEFFTSEFSKLRTSEFETSEARQLLFNSIQKSASILDSGIVKATTDVIEDFKNNTMPKSTRDLALNGNDLMELGFQGVEIKNRFDFFLSEIFSEKRENNKEDLLR